jgi:hypothetical protein
MAALPPLPGTDWTDRERAEINRLGSNCHDRGNWHLECSHTDAGDPFCVVHDQHSDVVVLHIARIDRRYVIDSPARESSVTAPTIEAAIDIATTELELLA